MTEKSLATGTITIRPDALRRDLETTEVKAGDMASGLWHNLAECRRTLYAVALCLPSFSDASDATLTTIAEVDEILINLKTRISLEEPAKTALQRHAKA